MAGRAKLVGQGLALLAVAALLALLVWRVVMDDRSDVPGDVAAGKAPPAPGFALPRLDEDGTLSLASLRGKAVVVNFWASWCAPCKEEAPLLERAWQRYRENGLVVVGVDARDFRGDALAFARKNGLTYPIVHDGPGETATDYGVDAFPETFVIDRKGRVLGQIRGALNVNGDIEAEFQQYVERALTS